MKGDPKKEDKELLKRRKILEEPFKKVAFAFVRTTIIIIIIFYLGILLISRTAGFRSIIAERLESQLGIPFEIGGSGFDTKLNLHTRDIKSTAPLLERGHIQVDRLSTFWSLAGLLSKDKPLVHKIILDGVSLQVVATEKNGWQPAVFGLLGEIEGFDQMAGSPASAKASAGKTNELTAVEAPVEEQPSETTSKRFHSIVMIQNSQINLLHGSGRRVANFGNVEFEYVPGYNEGLEVQLYKLDGNYVMLNSKVPRQKLELEVLNAGDEIMVRRMRAGADLLVSLAGFLGGDDVAEEVPPPVIARPRPEPTVLDSSLVLETPATASVGPSPNGASSNPIPRDPVPTSARIEHLQVQPVTPGTPRRIDVGIMTPAPAILPEPAPVDPLASTNDVADEILSQIEAIFNPGISNEVARTPRTVPPRVALAPEPIPEPAPAPEPVPAPKPEQPEVPVVVRPAVLVRPAAAIKPSVLVQRPPPRTSPFAPAPGVVQALVPEDLPAAIEPPNVLSEIEKVLEDAMRMQEESALRRKLAEQKFAAISNEYLVISNAIERAVQP